jgi:DNA adenine methylase
MRIRGHGCDGRGGPARIPKWDIVQRMSGDVPSSGAIRVGNVEPLQLQVVSVPPIRRTPPQHGQLLKWIGNKQRQAAEIASYFPDQYGMYYEPFLGSGGVLATVAPAQGAASDSFAPLIEIFRALRHNRDELKRWYTDRWTEMNQGDKVGVYEQIKASYNARPNGADLLFLCRSCYGGVVRFRKADGYMSTPCGAHRPIPPESFGRRVDEWAMRVAGSTFEVLDYTAAMAEAKEGDLVYCDPPYRDSQTILYGAQDFSFSELLAAIRACKERGVFVALSIDGTKQSGKKLTTLPLPHDLFEREIFIDCGRSMLKRFQMVGQDLGDHVVADRLLLTY